MKVRITSENVIIWILVIMLVFGVANVVHYQNEINARAQAANRRSDFIECLMANQALEGEAETIVDRREAEFEAGLAESFAAATVEERDEIRKRLNDPPTFREVLEQADAILAQRKECIQS